MAYKDDVNSELIFTIGAISGLVVVVMVIGLQAWFMSEEQKQISGDYSQAVNRPLNDLRNEQRAKLASYRWIDSDKKVAAIPIDQAKRLLIETKGKLPTTQPK